MPKDLINANKLTLELLREQFLKNDFTIMSDVLPENMGEGEAELYNKVMDFINDDWQKFAKEMGLKRPQMCYSEDFIPEALRLRVSRIVANAIIKILRDENALNNILTTFVLPQMLSPLVNLVEQIDKTGLADEDAKELLEILKNPAKLEDGIIEDEFTNDECNKNNAFFDDETIEELRKEFGDEIADKAKDINLFYHSDNLLKHMVELLMNTMDVQSLIEIALANHTLNELLKIENENGDVIESTLGSADGAFKLGELNGVFKNGDKLTLTITDKALEGFKEFEVIGEKSKEYTVNSDSKYILSAADLTDDARKELDKIAEEYLNSQINEMSTDTRDLIVSAATGLNIGALKAGKSQRIDDLKVKGLNSAYVGIGEITDWGVKKEVKRAYYFYNADAKYYAKDFFDVLDGEKPLILAVTISDPKITPNGIEYSGLIFSAVKDIETANKWITSKLEKLP